MSELLCPLKKRGYADNGTINEPYCDEERCAWWDLEGERCAVLDFARMFGCYIEHH